MVLLAGRPGAHTFFAGTNKVPTLHAVYSHSVLHVHIAIACR